MRKFFFIVFSLALAFSGFAQKNVIEVEKPTSLEQSERNIKRKVAIGRFSNETQYAKGIFYDKENDPMGKQALDILSSKLAASGKFILLERGDLDKVLEEVNNGSTSFQKVGADYLIVGSITEYGRKNIGDVKVFSSSKTQVVEAAVSIRLVDVSTGLIIYSDESKGSAELTTKTTLGIGGRADYDATLSDKAISVAISQLVDNIINKCTDKPWRSYFLAFDEEAIISGGATQGLAQGDLFIVKKKGKIVTNPQTGIKFELPGKEVAKVSIEMTGGDTPETEFSIVNFKEGSIDKNNLADYYIEEIKQ
ncbi:CsgG/HfaB family protein [Macellibacteroides fermentans]|jgi:curli biogenesis system outer membrane secretion channel CsgG|uniref:CsgG/HfaB family protein n=1 Tax=Macellibacteroides fermentans TaxID=879969 RepID=UPI003B933E53